MRNVPDLPWIDLSTLHRRRQTWCQHGAWEPQTRDFPFLYLLRHLCAACSSTPSCHFPRTRRTRRPCALGLRKSRKCTSFCRLWCRRDRRGAPEPLCRELIAGPVSQASSPFSQAQAGNTIPFVCDEDFLRFLWKIPQDRQRFINKNYLIDFWQKK